MNVFDYFFEKTSGLEKDFLVGKETISFRDLYKTSMTLAGYIKERIGEGKNVMLLSPNNVFFLQSYLAILKSGNVCIPLDPAIETENFSYIAGLTNPDLVFITGDIERRLNITQFNKVNPDSIGTLKPGQDEGHFNGSYDSEKCAEIIFTSGSTGKPKGVMISHKNLIANTNSILEYLKLTDNDRMLCVLPFYYCYGLSLLHTHLRIGGSIVFNNSFIFLGKIIKDFLEHKCTGFAGVPSHFQILLRMSDSFKQTKFPDLRYVTQAGGKLAPVFIDEFRQSFPDVTFYVMYGQTEATARLSYLPPEIYEQKRGSMGKGIPGVELKVVNEKGQNIKPGETGEVIAHGDNIMIGYFADPEGTAASIKNGWLYTGDLGTVDEDGYIYLTARKKEIIKVGGKRVSPKEIEAVILQIPEVVDCSIEGVEDEIQGEALRASVIVRKGTLEYINEEAIKQHCIKHLALFKVPQIYDIKDQMTISPTGKKIKK